MRELSTDTTTHTLSTTSTMHTAEVARTDVLDPAQVDALATSVALDGLDAHGGEALAFAYAARGRDVSPVLLEVLTDTGAPEVVRLRAFGLVVRALARPARRTHVATPDPVTTTAASRVPVLV